MAKFRLSLALLLVTLAPAAVRGDEGEAHRLLEVSRARVLSSPGTPRALEPFLPGRTLDRPLAWPLPDGPLVVLGLPDTDPHARALADVFQLSAEPENLLGGYGLWAWHDGQRPLVVVLGADPAALYAARFEFDAHAPVGANHPDARSVDFDRPNEEAGLVVRAGTRFVRPRYRVRAWHPGRALPADADVALAAARGNRLWLDPALTHYAAVNAITSAPLRDLGVKPVAVLRMSFDPAASSEALLADVKKRVAVLRHWQEAHGIRHFALVFDTPLETLRRAGGADADGEMLVALDVAGLLRPHGLEELVVVPRCHSDRLAREYGPQTDLLRTIPEALMAWSGPDEHSVEITRADAERRRREAGVPVVLLDRWSVPFQAADGHVPCAPYGRAEDLHEVLEGVIVVGARHAEATLDSAWGPETEERFGAGLLTPLIPVEDLDAVSFLRRCTAALERQAQEDLGFVTWMPSLAGDLRDAAARIEAGTPAVTVPVVPRGVTLDGRIDEPSWAYARSIPTGIPDVDVLVLSDGRFLHFAFRASRDERGATPARLHLHLRVPQTSIAWEVTPGADPPFAICRGAAYGEGHVHAARRESQDRTVTEVSFDRFALHGEAIPTRRFEITLTNGTVAWGAAPVWPPAGSEEKAGLLVITR